MSALDERRFIPACVGNAVAIFTVSRETAVHPRVCGERSMSDWVTAILIGSSPRVWGTLPGCHGDCAAYRFIPACVGNACPRFGSARGDAVHPRVCGEREALHLNCNRAVGSSPRVWGTPARAGAGHPPVRFIPACVGNAPRRRAARFRPAVHPRVCGERDEILLGVRPGDGSSPRVWGTRWELAGAMCRGRFIPACVGNAYPVRSYLTIAPVHPRVCGERHHSSASASAISGSSPRVWGTRVRRQRRRGLLPVHPRVCGEREKRLRVVESHDGSSPRVWGTHTEIALRDIEQRFIPACVGNAGAGRGG